jgi:hypothetical protein
MNYVINLRHDDASILLRSTLLVRCQHISVNFLFCNYIRTKNYFSTSQSFAIRTLLRMGTTRTKLGSKNKVVLVLSKPINSLGSSAVKIVFYSSDS